MDKFSVLIVKKFNREDQVLVFKTPLELQYHVNDIVAREIESIYESGYDFKQDELLAIADIKDIMERGQMNLVTLRAFVNTVVTPHASRRQGGLVSFEFRHNQEFATSEGVRVGQLISLGNISKNVRIYDGSGHRLGFVVTFDNAAPHADLGPRYYATFGFVQDRVKPEIRSFVGGCTITLHEVQEDGSTRGVATYDSDHDEWMRV